MANYSIRTTRKQEVGLKFAYDGADKNTYPTQESYFQYRIDTQVSDPLYGEQQRAMAVSFDSSFNSIPELEQPAAKTEIEAVITSHGGTIVPPPMPMSAMSGGYLGQPGTAITTDANNATGSISNSRGAVGDSVQAGSTDKTDDGSGR